MNTTMYNGKKYTVYGNDKYFKRGKKYLHRIIWADNFGQIPDGHHIHHKDGNKLNNDILNLECISRKSHYEEHRNQRSEIAKVNVVMAQAKYKELKNIISESVCIQCNKYFKTTEIRKTVVKYCSKKCHNRYRIEKGDKFSIIKCEICGTEKVTDKHRKTKTCGRKCGNLLKWKTQRGL